MWVNTFAPPPHRRLFYAAAAPSREEVRQGMTGGASLRGACDLRSIPGGGGWALLAERGKCQRSVSLGRGLPAAVGLETTPTSTSLLLLD